MVYKRIATGGTFDYLHKGHKEFLKNIFSKGERILIGLTSDEYVSQNKKGKSVASYEERKIKLEKFLRHEGVSERVDVISIDDLYGPTLDKELDIDALAVSSASLENAQKINTKRQENGLQTLSIIEIPLVKDLEGNVISASRIRVGEIDTEGNQLVLPDALRHKLSEAWGEVLTEVPQEIEASRIITVGDVTTKKFLEKSLEPLLSIIDNKVERKEVKFVGNFSSETRIIRIDNAPGTINKDVFSHLSDIFWFNQKTLIIVNGEEDLLVLPVLLFAPLGFMVFYGQPHVGLVKIIVTKEVKNKAQEILNEFRV